MSILEDLLTKNGHDRSAYAPFWPEEDNSKPVKPVKQSISALTSTSWRLEFYLLEDYHLLADEISALGNKSVEGNLFIEPEFLQAGIQRIEDKGVLLLCLWEEIPGSRALRFFMPVVLAKSGLPRQKILKGFTHHFAPLGTPLLHREGAEETAENLLRILGDPELEIPSVISFEQQRLGGTTVQILKSAAHTLGLHQSTILPCQRATLLALDEADVDGDVHGFLRQSLGKKRHKEYARLLRRLNEVGEVTFEIARTEDKILDAIEGFLTLEARGWKGRSGTALYSLKQIAAFSRQAVSAMAKVNRCEIHSMKTGDKIVAGLICFKRDGELFTWKIAFDEDYNTYSPGVQLILNASGNWLKRKAFISADSLASSNHPMINHLWRQRMDIGTVLVEVGNSNTNNVEKTAKALERYDWVRTQAKSILVRMKKLF